MANPATVVTPCAFANELIKVRVVCSGNRIVWLIYVGSLDSHSLAKKGAAAAALDNNK